MFTSTAHVSAPLDATAVLVDLRNFTPNLKASPVGADGSNVFCELLAHFYGICVEAAIIAVGASDTPPMYLNSTGDGVLMVFFDPDHHYRHGFLTTLMLNCTLRSVCETYNAEHGRPGVPTTSFGIGIESGQVCRVTDTGRGGDVVVETYIGDCINVAARAEGFTKSVHETHAIVGVHTNSLLCRALCDANYQRLMNVALDQEIDDDARLAIHDEMMTLNRRLCLTFMQVTVLKGVDEPIPLFRVSKQRARTENAQFQSLVQMLTRSPEHKAAVMSFLDRLA